VPFPTGLKPGVNETTFNAEMKKILEIALGIVTSVGGFLEIGSITPRLKRAPISLSN